MVLLSDAGTPGISDPAVRLVRKCREEGLSISALPGPCAAIMALSITGFKTHRFQFLGFPPKKKGSLKNSSKRLLPIQAHRFCMKAPTAFYTPLLLFKNWRQTALLPLQESSQKFMKNASAAPLRELLKKLPRPKGEIVLIIDS